MINIDRCTQLLDCYRTADHNIGGQEGAGTCQGLRPEGGWCMSEADAQRCWCLLGAEA